MKYLRIVNEEIHYPYILGILKNEYPTTSFPEDINLISLEDYNIHSVNEVNKPSNENFTKLIREELPVLIDGNYYQNWKIEDAPIEYTETILGVEINNKWSQIRSMRNQYLAETDWTQLFDSPLIGESKENWIEYRQSLRDITDQEDPFNIDWPIKPGSSNDVSGSNELSGSNEATGSNELFGSNETSGSNEATGLS